MISARRGRVGLLGSRPTPSLGDYHNQTARLAKRTRLPAGARGLLKRPQFKFASARSTFVISLCRTDTVWPSSHLIVTPLHVTPTMVPRSVMIFSQHTRSATLSCLDCS